MRKGGTMLRNSVAVAVFISLFLLASSAVAQTDSSAQATGERVMKTWVTMRDGIKLATEIFIPAAEGKYPVVLQRTPTTKRSGYTATKRGRKTDTSTSSRIAGAALSRKGTGTRSLPSKKMDMTRSPGSMHNRG